MNEEPNSADLAMGAMHAERSDRSLLRQFRSGDDDAATRLYLRYARRLAAVARTKSGSALASRIDPEDIVQSVFRTFFRRAAAGQYDVPEGEELWKLFLVIALNKVRSSGSFHTAAKRDARLTRSQDREADAGRQTAADDHDSLRTLQMVIDEILETMPQSHRQMVELRIAGHEVQEISTATGRAQRSVERVLQQFRQRLGRLIDESLHGH